MDEDTPIWAYLIVGVFVLGFFYGIIMLAVGASNALTLQDECNYGERVNGSYVPSKTVWIANPLTIGLTGECKEK